MTVQVKQAIGILLWQALMLAMLIGLASWAQHSPSEPTPASEAMAITLAAADKNCPLEAAATQAIERLEEFNVEPKPRVRLLDIGLGW